MFDGQEFDRDEDILKEKKQIILWTIVIYSRSYFRTFTWTQKQKWANRIIDPAQQINGRRTINNMDIFAFILYTCGRQRKYTAATIFLLQQKKTIFSQMLARNITVLTRIKWNFTIFIISVHACSSWSIESVSVNIVSSVDVNLVTTDYDIVPVCSFLPPSGVFVIFWTSPLFCVRCSLSLSIWIFPTFWTSSPSLLSLPIGQIVSYLLFLLCVVIFSLLSQLFFILIQVTLVATIRLTLDWIRSKHPIPMIAK